MIYVVIGTRSGVIKMAPVMNEMQKRDIRYRYIFTGQHHKTIKELESDLELRAPDINLNPLKEVSTIPYALLWFLKIVLKSLLKRKEVFGPEKKGVILLHADNLTALYGAIVGKLLRMKVGHVEAGLRSFNLFKPFPEEIIRMLIHYMADYYYCQNEWAVNNLKRYKGVKVNTCANTLYDSLSLILKRIDNVKVDIPDNKYGLVSFHRFDNISTRERLSKIINVLEEIAKKIDLLFVLHPPTLNSLKRFGLYERLMNNPAIDLRSRYNYTRFNKLIVKSEFMITDSGSGHDECYYLGHPCLFLREKAERTEGLDENIVLSGLDEDLALDFVDHYENYRYGFKQLNESPSGMIVDSLENEGYGRSL